MDIRQRWTRPRWVRSVVVRRLLAVALAALAVALLVRGDPDATLLPVVVANGDLSAGRALRETDLRQERRPAGTVPAHSVRDVSAITGRVLAAPLRSGEILTDVRTIGPRLAVAATGSADTRMVAIRLVDAGIVDLIRAGDRVDVVANSAVLASDAMVVLVSDGGKDRTVLIALSTRPATAVAAASLARPLTVVFH